MLSTSAASERNAASKYCDQTYVYSSYHLSYCNSQHIPTMIQLFLLHAARSRFLVIHQNAHNTFFIFTHMLSPTETSSAYPDSRRSPVGCGGAAERTPIGSVMEPSRTCVARSANLEKIIIVRNFRKKKKWEFSSLFIFLVTVYRVS